MAVFVSARCEGIIRRKIWKYRILIMLFFVASIIYMAYLAYKIPNNQDLTKSLQQHGSALDAQLKDHMFDIRKHVHEAHIKIVNNVNKHFNETHSKFEESHKTLRDQIDELVALPVKVIQNGIENNALLKNISQPAKGKWDVLKKQVDGIKDLVKNKTLEGLDQIGGVFKALDKAKETLFEPNALNFSLNRNDVELYMKYLNSTHVQMLADFHRQEKSEMAEYHKAGQKLLDENIKLNTGSCNCTLMKCDCCCSVNIPKLNLNHKACLNIMYLPKPRTPLYHLKFEYRGKSTLNKTVPAFDPPEVCLGGLLSITELCIAFRNTTIKMPNQNSPTSIYSCVDFSMNFFMTTVAVYPVGCFTLESKEISNDDLHLNKIGHQFVP